MVTASSCITVYDLLKEIKRHSLFTSWIALVQVVINVSPEHLVERLYSTPTIKKEEVSSLHDKYN